MVDSYEKDMQIITVHMADCKW